MEHKGAKQGGGEVESGWNTAGGPPLRDTQHDNGDSDETTAETQIDAER